MWSQTVSVTSAHIKSPSVGFKARKVQFHLKAFVKATIFHQVMRFSCGNNTKIIQHLMCKCNLLNILIIYCSLLDSTQCYLRILFLFYFVSFIYLTGLLVWCQAVETELTKLGQNVTINCDLDEKEIYWMVLKPPNRPVMILRLFSTSPTPFYYDVGFRPKYSVQHKYCLFIKNVTVDELGIYYCMTTEAPPKFSNGTKLHIIGE